MAMIRLEGLFSLFRISSTFQRGNSFRIKFEALYIAIEVSSLLILQCTVLHLF